MINKLKRYTATQSKTFLVSIVVLLSLDTTAQVNNLSVTENFSSSSFPLVSAATAASFYYDKADAAVVGIAATAFANDINLIAGKQIKLNTGNKVTDKDWALAKAIEKIYERTKN